MCECKCQKPLAEPKPFDLEAAKRGEPIQMYNGRPAKFVAHEPTACCDWARVVVCVTSPSGKQRLTFCSEDGKFKPFHYGRGWVRPHLLMAPKPARTAKRDVVMYEIDGRAYVATRHVGQPLPGKHTVEIARKRITITEGEFDSPQS